MMTELESLSREDAIHPGPIGLCGMSRPSQEQLEAMKSKMVKYDHEVAEHFRKKKEKYALAISRPWLPVPPDPPVPE